MHPKSGNPYRLGLHFILREPWREMAMEITEAGLNDLEKRVRKAAEAKPKVKERLPHILRYLSMLRKHISEKYVGAAVMTAFFLDDELYGSGFAKPSLLRVAERRGGRADKSKAWVWEVLKQAMAKRKKKKFPGIKACLTAYCGGKENALKLSPNRAWEIVEQALAKAQNRNFPAIEAYLKSLTSKGKVLNLDKGIVWLSVNKNADRILSYKGSDGEDHIKLETVRKEYFPKIVGK